MGQVAAPGLGGATQGGGELDHRELRHLRTPLPTQRQAGLVPRLDGTDHRVTRVHRRKPRRGPEHLPGLVVLRRLVRPGTRQHGSGVVRSRERERVQGRGHRGTNSTIEHRHSRGVGSSLWTRDSGAVGVDGKWTLQGQSGRWLRGSRQARSAVGVSQCLRCGGFETVAARPPQPPVGKSQRNHGRTAASPPAAARQPARLWPSPGLSTRPRTPAKAPRLDSPGEGQTLGCRVADVPKPASRAGPSAGCGGLDKLDQRWASGCLRCGGFETVAARPPQPPVGKSQRNHGQTAASPPAAARQPACPLALAGAVNPPREPQRRHPGLTAPVRVRHSAVGLPTYPSQRREQVPAQAAVVSTSSTSGGRAGAYAAEVSRRSQRDLLNQRWASPSATTARPQPDHRRQPDSQPAFGPRRGCQPAPETAA